MPGRKQVLISSHQVPQKEDLDSIAKIPLLFKNGLKTSKEIATYFNQSDRHGAFFLNACRILGWIEGDHITQQGDLLIACPEDQRREIIKEAVRNTEIFNALVFEFGHDFIRKPAIEPISSFLENKVGLKKVTAFRRAQSVLKWLQYLNREEQHRPVYPFDVEEIVRPIVIDDLTFDTGVVDNNGHPRAAIIDCFKYGLYHNLLKIQKVKDNGCHFIFLAPTSDYLNFDLSINTEFSEMREKLHYCEVKGTKKEARSLANSIMVSDKHVMELSRKFRQIR